jgi:hypothetical protein
MSKPWYYHIPLDVLDRSAMMHGTCMPRSDLAVPSSHHHTKRFRDFGRALLAQRQMAVLFHQTDVGHRCTNVLISSFQLDHIGFYRSISVVDPKRCTLPPRERVEIRLGHADRKTCWRRMTGHLMHIVIHQTRAVSALSEVEATRPFPLMGVKWPSDHHSRKQCRQHRDDHATRSH